MPTINYNQQRSGVSKATLRHSRRVPEHFYGRLGGEKCEERSRGGHENFDTERSEEPPEHLF